ncbi:MAG: hypothetical protein QM731_23315 [Chitinophagaceae bacterium]
MKKILLSASLFALMAHLSFCKKSSSGESASNTELITSATWKFDNAWLDTDKDGKADSPIPSIYLKSCQTDNQVTLVAGGTGSLDEGASKCSVDDPQTNSFTWSFKDNEATINLSTAIIAGVEGDIKITALTETKLQLQKEVTYAGLSQSVNVILDLKH